MHVVNETVVLHKQRHRAAAVLEEPPHAAPEVQITGPWAIGLTQQHRLLLRKLGRTLVKQVLILDETSRVKQAS